MTAHRMAIACGLAALAMGTIDRAEAFDDWPMPAHLDADRGADRKAQRPAVSAALDNDFDRRNGVTGAAPRAAHAPLFDGATIASQQAGLNGASLDRVHARAPRRPGSGPPCTAGSGQHGPAGSAARTPAAINRR